MCDRCTKFSCIHNVFGRRCRHSRLHCIEIDVFSIRPIAGHSLDEVLQMSSNANDASTYQPYLLRSHINCDGLIETTFFHRFVGIMCNFRLSKCETNCHGSVHKPSKPQQIETFRFRQMIHIENCQRRRRR